MRVASPPNCAAFAINPSDCAADLIGDRQQTHLRVFHAVEVDQHEVRAGRYECFGGERVALGGIGFPCAAVDEHEHRRAVTRGAVDVDVFHGPGP